MTRDNDDYQVGYLGIPGSYSYQAGLFYFNNIKKRAVLKRNMIGSNDISGVFRMLVEGKCLYGVVPVENSTTGSIGETFDRLLDTPLTIVGEIILKIHHNLLANINTDPSSLKKCYSHPQAISQCRKFLSGIPDLKIEFTSDTATAASFLSEKKELNSCCIAGKMTAVLYGLKILKTNIEDNPYNYTRFFIIGRKQAGHGNKISLVYSLAHIPGSLVASLTPFADLGLNLTKIESRPVIGKPWEYLFYVDLESNEGSGPKEAFLRLKEVTDFLKILGKYEKGEIYET